MAEARTSTTQRLDRYTLLALFVGLLGYPAIYCSGIMGRIIAPVFTGTSRLHCWWYSWLAILAFHWIPFAFICSALSRNHERWIDANMVPAP